MGLDFNYPGRTRWIIRRAPNRAASPVPRRQDSLQPERLPRTLDFRYPSQLTANAVVELPIGKGKALLSGTPKWLDYAIGGWQVSTLFSFRLVRP